MCVFAKHLYLKKQFGRSTQIKLLVDWLEAKGYASTQVGLKRSSLASEELERAKNGNILNRTTLSLFYATDFADQLENIIIPSLRAGFIVLADRYIYTLMARDLVRGLDDKWVHNLYSIALQPDAVFYLKLSPEKLYQRNFMKNHTLDYWESGMDLGLSKDIFNNKNGTISFTVRDLLKTRLRRYERIGENFKTIGEFSWRRTQNFRLSLQYRINQNKRKSSQNRGSSQDYQEGSDAIF